MLLGFRPTEGSLPARLVGLMLVFCLLAGSSGCTRRFFRQRADREVLAVLKEKDQFPFWKIENWHVYPDPRARFADPTNPDKPPMPPDDPAARYLGPNPQKPYHKSGVAWIEGKGYLRLLEGWDAQNRVTLAEHELKELPPTSQASLVQLSFQETGAADPPLKQAQPAFRPFLIRADQAVELGLINSREYQSRREDLYLVALPVTLERFAFTAQFQLAETAIRESTGRETVYGKGNRWRFNTNAGFSKLFPYGGLLLVSFANRTTIELTGSQLRHTTSVSDLNLDLVQPLLRGGGKAITLEPLTQTERNLLYEIRSYARFRKEFFHNVTAGGDINTIGAAGGYGLRAGGATPGSEAVNAITANPIRPTILPGNAGRFLLNTDRFQGADGFMPTLLRAAILEVERKNVASLEKVLRLFEAYEEGGEVSALQVGQVKIQLLNSQNTVLQREQEYRDALDRLKLQLGLPVNIPLELETAPIRPVVQQLRKFEKAINDFEELSAEIDQLDAREKVHQLRGQIGRILTESNLVKSTTEFRTRTPGRWKAWADLDLKTLGKKLEALREERRLLLDEKSKWEEEGKTVSPAQQKRIEVLDREIALGDLEFTLRRYEDQPWKNLPDPRNQIIQHGNRFRDVRNSLVLVLGEASNERLAMIRPAWPRLSDIIVGGQDVVKSDLDHSYEVVTKVALENRLDLMNIRAAAVDAWREIRVFANLLLGVFNVGYHMDSTTPPDQAKPLAFSPSRTRHQLILNGELPLVRLAERNNYRASLIGYQRARRNLMLAEDLIANQVRADLRNLRVLAEQYKIQQQAVELAFLQVESALETFRQPPTPGAGGSNAASAAALTQQLLNAYAGLPRAQNQLLAIWINYQVARQQLYLDLEMMPLDYRGVWIDELSSDHPSPPEIGFELPPPQILPPQ